MIISGGGRRELDDISERVPKRAGPDDIEASAICFLVKMSIVVWRLYTQVELIVMTAKIASTPQRTLMVD